MHIKSPKIMNKVLNKSAEGLIDYSDIVLFVTQRLKLDDQDMSVLKKLKEANAKVICVVNKIDQIEDKQKLLPLIERLSELYDFLEIIPISALLDEGIEVTKIIVVVDREEGAADKLKHYKVPFASLISASELSEK